MWRVVTAPSRSPQTNRLASLLKCPSGLTDANRGWNARCTAATLRITLESLPPSLPEKRLSLVPRTDKRIAETRVLVNHPNFPSCESTRSRIRGSHGVDVVVCEIWRSGWHPESRKNEPRSIAIK